MLICPKYLSMITPCSLVTGFLIFLLVISPDAIAQPHLPRTGKNLIPNSKMAGKTKWLVLNGATYDSTVSRTNDGSGSINMGLEKSLLVSSKITVTPGKTYTYGMYLMEDGLLPGTLRIFVKVFSKSGKVIRNASGTNQSISDKNKWYESAVVFTPASRRGICAGQC